MDLRDSMVASGCSSSPTPPTASTTAAPPPPSHPSPPPHPPPLYDYRNRHLDTVAPGPVGAFAFQMGPNPHCPHAEASLPVSEQQSPGAGRGSQDELARKKRGRPRKYKPDGAGLSPSTPGSEKRPPGSGKMQQLASLGNRSLAPWGHHHPVRRDSAAILRGCCSQDNVLLTTRPKPQGQSASCQHPELSPQQPFIRMQAPAVCSHD